MFIITVSGAQLYRELVMADNNEEKTQEYSKEMVNLTTQPERMIQLSKHNTGQDFF